MASSFGRLYLPINGRGIVSHFRTAGVTTISAQVLWRVCNQVTTFYGIKSHKRREALFYLTEFSVHVIIIISKIIGFGAKFIKGDLISQLQKKRMLVTILIDNGKDKGGI